MAMISPSNKSTVFGKEMLYKILSSMAKVSVEGVFHPNSIFSLLRSEYRIRILINILFLTIEIGGVITNLYFFLRICAFMRSMQLIKSHYRAIMFYNQYTYICVTLCLHLSISGVCCCILIMCSHIYLSYTVIKNEHLNLPKTDSIFSCNYIPFLRDAFTNVFVYIMLLVLVIYRRADITSISQRMHVNNQNPNNNINNNNNNNNSMHSTLAARRQKARLVLLHSLPWVLSLGLALPRGLLDMRYDFRKSYKLKMEAPLSEELCVHQSKDNDIVNLSMWGLQAWMPLVLTFFLCVTYSIKDQFHSRTSRSARSNQLKKNRTGHSRRNSTTTLGGMKHTDMYSSSRTLYSLHNYKEEVVRLVKSSPIIFYIILILTLILRTPFNLVYLIDSAFYLAHSTFLINHLIVITTKSVDYLHMALMPMLVLQAVIILCRNSLKICQIRSKVKRLAETDQSLIRSTLNINRSPRSHYGDDNIGLDASSSNIVHVNHGNTINNHNRTLNHNNNSNININNINNNNLNTNGSLMMHNNGGINNINNNNNNNLSNLSPNHNNNNNNDDDSDYDDSEKPFMLSTV